MIALLCLGALIARAISFPLSTMDRIWQANKGDTNAIAFDGSKHKVIEMDIVSTPQLQSQIRAFRAGVSLDAMSDPNTRWKDGIVPYVISSSASVELRKAFSDAIKEFNGKTCIKIVPRTNQADYIKVIAGDGCYSSLGRQGGVQEVSLGSGCEDKGTAIHELMHALGFFHEQSRRDRDSYIKVLFQNIEPENSYNFDMYLPGEADTLGEPYDKKSVMHYGNYAFSKNGQKTIVSLSNPNEVLGDGVDMSEIDARQLNKHYKCGVTLPVTKPPAPSCVNLNNRCRHWTRYCRNKNYATYMKVNCPKTCNLC